MSNRYQTRSPLLSGVDFSKMTGEDLKAAFLEILNNGIHGISFSVYLNDQAPGSQISAQQISERMQVIKPYVKWIRSFSCTDGNEQIPRIGHENGLKTLVGAWLGSDAEKNEREIEAVIKVAQAGHADIVAVGNEVLLRGDLSEDQLIGLIQRVKQAIPGIPVGYVDAYYEFAVHPRVSDACDVILAN
ncbi:MAG: glycosyl hydrolase, partial [Calditrichaeota bacterium]|nr:glycosyl hydrolase [Calditrichota bacterium]